MSVTAAPRAVEAAAFHSSCPRGTEASGRRRDDLRHHHGRADRGASVLPGYDSTSLPVPKHPIACCCGGRGKSLLDRDFSRRNAPFLQSHRQYVRLIYRLRSRHQDTTAHQEGVSDDPNGEIPPCSPRPHLLSPSFSPRCPLSRPSRSRKTSSAIPALMAVR